MITAFDNSRSPVITELARPVTNRKANQDNVLGYYYSRNCKLITVLITVFAHFAAKALKKAVSQGRPLCHYQLNWAALSMFLITDYDQIVNELSAKY
jgi:hypothetical protein